MTDEVKTTVLSVVPAVVGSAIVIRVSSHPRLTPRQHGFGALWLALGIGTMHYLGIWLCGASRGAVRRSPCVSQPNPPRPPREAAA
mgnify:CR=1 FL=1